MIKSVICLVFSHTIDRRRVWHDGLSFRTNCTRCNAALLRERDGWRKFDNATDQTGDRQPHPSKREMA